MSRMRITVSGLPDYVVPIGKWTLAEGLEMWKQKLGKVISYERGVNNEN